MSLDTSMLAEPSRVAPRRRTRWAWAAVAVIVIGWLAGTHTPPDGLPSLRGSDKVKHFAGYTLIALSLGVALARGGASIPRMLAIGLLVGAALGAFDELTQPLVRRRAEWGDYLADLLGTLTGTFLAATFTHLLRVRARTTAVP